VKATTMKKSNTPFSVLSIANGSADYDRVIITSLATVRPKLAYVSTPRCPYRPYHVFAC